jgi:hypothetical protein
MENIKAIIKSQMRSGTHYLLANMCQVYGLKPAIIGRNNDIIYKDFKFLNKGLHKNIVTHEKDFESVVLQFHYYHNPPFEIDNHKLLNLIGFPIDSFISDMGNFALYGKSEVYSFTRRNGKSETRKINLESKAFIFFKDYIDMNAKWLDVLIEEKSQNIIRFEDFFISFQDAIDKIQNKFGRIHNKFEEPNALNERTYWSDKYLEVLDIEVLKYLIARFKKSLIHFYPEKSDKLLSFL